MFSALTSPRVFGFRLGFASIGIIGLLSAIAANALSVDTTINTVTTLLPALATILSLMLMVGWPERTVRDYSRCYFGLALFLVPFLRMMRLFF